MGPPVPEPGLDVRLLSTPSDRMLTLESGILAWQFTNPLTGPQKPHEEPDPFGTRTARTDPGVKRNTWRCRARPSSPSKQGSATHPSPWRFASPSSSESPSKSSSSPQEVDESGRTRRKPVGLITTQLPGRVATSLRQVSPGVRADSSWSCLRATKRRIELDFLAFRTSSAKCRA